MSRDDESNDVDDGLSRRDFVRGRFLRAFGVKSTDANESVAENKQRRKHLEMRYPRTLHQVAAGDDSPRSEASLLAAPDARRRTVPIFRPPGAIEETSFLAGCTKCGECIDACPHDAIVKASNQFREAAGTPTILADHAACMMCRDFPCIAACEPNVLTSLVPPTMGTAKVTEHLCLAHHGTTCTVCSERCPVDNAITVVDGKPTVNESNCTGCGVCRYVCPAPENAILLMPAFLRPNAPPTPASND